MPPQKKPLTVSEIACTDLQLSGEELLAKKYMSYANQVSNSELVKFCIQMATRHVQNFTTLYHALEQHPPSVQGTSQQQEWQKLTQQASQTENQLQQMQ